MRNSQTSVSLQAMDVAYSIGAAIGALFGAALIGVLVYRQRRGKLQHIRWLSVFALTFITALVSMIAMTVLLPPHGLFPPPHGFFPIASEENHDVNGPVVP